MLAAACGGCLQQKREGGSIFLFSLSFVYSIVPHNMINNLFIVEPPFS
jgi:hypothetical protein